MPFLGKSPSEGNHNVLLDAITTSATATYNLTKDSVAYTPVSAQSLMVSLNGVTQAPIAAYTVSGSTIVFASALTSNDVIDYIISFEGPKMSVDASNIGAGQITTAMIADDGITSAKIADDAITSALIADDAVVQAAIADDAVDEARIQISNAGSNGQFLSKQSGNTGGLTWATVSTAPAAGEIIETIHGVADGRQIIVQSGTYTLQNVTAGLGLSTTHTEIPGSNISYTPPSTAKWVKYRFDFHWEAMANSGISHYKINFDGTDITHSKVSKAGGYQTNHHDEDWMHVEWIINCDADSDSLADGKLTSWTSAKVIKAMGREYSSGYNAAVNANTYWDGASASGVNEWVPPILTIQAIA